MLFANASNGPILPLFFYRPVGLTSKMRMPASNNPVPMHLSICIRNLFDMTRGFNGPLLW